MRKIFLRARNLFPKLSLPINLVWNSHIWLFPAGMLFLPMVAMAAAVSTLETFIDKMETTLTRFVFPFLFVVATVIFVVSIIRYLYSAEADQAKIRSTILWSVIGLAAIISLWALVGFLASYIGIKDIPTQFGRPIL